MIGRFVKLGRSWRSTDAPAAGTVLPEPGLAPAYPDPRRLAIGIVFFLVLGFLLRIVRYAQNLPLWSDECFLAVNFIHRGYAELLQPLDNGQIAPVLFLWAERLVIDLVGFSESGLRLFALLCGLASVFSSVDSPSTCRVSHLTGTAGDWRVRGQPASDSPCRRGEALCIRPPLSVLSFPHLCLNG